MQGEIHHGPCSVARVWHELLSQMPSRSALPVREQEFITSALELAWRRVEEEARWGRRMGWATLWPQLFSQSQESWAGPSVLLWVEMGSKQVYPVNICHWVEDDLYQSLDRGCSWRGVGWSEVVFSILGSPQRGVTLGLPTVGSCGEIHFSPEGRKCVSHYFIHLQYLLSLLI